MYLNNSFTTNKQLQRFARKYGVKIGAIDYKDKLKDFPRKNNHGYIINLANSGEGGSHWVCFYIHKKNAYYMDTYGVGPPMEVLNYLKDYKIYMNPYQLQNIRSGHCGQYCLLFLLHMTKNPEQKEFSKFLNKFELRRITS